MANTRTANSMKNIRAAFFNKTIILLLSFLSRRCFIDYIGVTYLGVNSLFTEIVGMLSLADLGFGTAMTYSFYKPIAENDKNKIAGLIGFYKKVYNIIAVAVLGLGLCVLPFLNQIVRTEMVIDHLKIYYLVFLLNTVVSYLFVYKSAVITASQKNYIVLKLQTWIDVVRYILQIIIIIFTHNFLYYLIIAVAATIVNNLLISKKAIELYPEIQNKGEVSKTERQGIIRNLSSMFLYKLSGTLLNSTDNTLISIICGTLYVGYYANYKIIITNLNSFVSILFNSVTASIGNLIAAGELKLRYTVFKVMQMISYALAALISTCLFILMNDFILLWLRSKQYLLDQFTLIAILLNLYIAVTLQPLWSYREATGLYRKTKYVMVAAAIINLLASIILGIKFGIGGIILASFLAKVSTYVWYEPKILFKEYFKTSSLKYLSGQLSNFILTVVCILVSSVCTNIVPVVSITSCIIKAIISVLIVTVIYTLRYFWTDEFKFIIRKIRDRVH